MTENGAQARAHARRNPHLRLACARCQRRKIRCDGQYPVCSNCRKASAECIDGDSVRLRPAYRDGVGAGVRSPAATPTPAHASVPEIARLKHRITWLESLLRERLPDVDLSAGPPPGSLHANNTGDGDTDSEGASSMRIHEPQDGHHPSFSTLQSSNISGLPPDERAHEIGLISVGANAEQRYLGPSSGHFLARVLLACFPQKDNAHVPDVSGASYVAQSAINDLVDAVHGPLPLPTRSLAEQLSEVYFDVIHPQWPILHEPSFHASLDQVYLDRDSRPKEPHLHFQTFMVLAISSTVLSFRTKRQVSGESYCLSALQYLDQINMQASLPGLQCMLLLFIFGFHSAHMRLNIWQMNYQCIAAVLDLGLQRNVTTSSGITFLTQEMRTRIFWTVITLDRTIATMMGRPIGLRDEACELRLPQNINDRDLTASDRSTEDQNSIRISIHLFKLAKLNSEIKYVANSIVRDAPTYAYPPITNMATWLHNTLDRVNEWASELPRLNIRNRYLKTICEIRSHSLKMLLLRPSPAIPTPTFEMLVMCHESARQTMRLYDQLYKQGLLVHDWITLHGTISTAITMLYCVRVVRDLAQELDLIDFMRDIGVSLSILSATGEHWSGAKRARDTLDDLAASTLRWIENVRATDGQRGGGMTAPRSAGTTGGDPSIGQPMADSNFDRDLLAAFPAPFMLPVEMQGDTCDWPAPYQQQDAFGDITNVDDMIRNLFDGFIPQQDNWNTAQGFYAT